MLHEYKGHRCFLENTLYGSKSRCSQNVLGKSFTGFAGVNDITLRKFESFLGHDMFQFLPVSRGGVAMGELGRKDD